MFEIERTLSFNTDILVNGDEYDYVTRTSANQGVLRTTGFINSININKAGTWSLGLLQMDFFYRQKNWYAGQFVRKIVPKIQIPPNSVPFFTTLFNGQKLKLLSVLVRNVDETFRNLEIQLPVKNGRIDFDFMENFITELEAQRYSELEAYLSVTGLKDTRLSLEEERAILDFDKIQWRAYRMEDLFEKLATKKLPYTAKELPRHPTTDYQLPCLTSSFQNQGLNYYAPKAGATIINDAISLPSNSDVYRAYYQPGDFTVLSDSYAIRWKSDKGLSPNQYLFAVVCINKVTNLSIYSYKNKLGGWNTVKNKYIMLPQKGHEIDFAQMDTLIAAIQKIVITDVVAYSDKKLAATKQAIDQ